MTTGNLKQFALQVVKLIDRFSQLDMDMDIVIDIIRKKLNE